MDTFKQLPENEKTSILVSWVNRYADLEEAYFELLELSRIMKKALCDISKKHPDLRIARNTLDIVNKNK